MPQTIWQPTRRFVSKFTLQKNHKFNFIKTHDNANYINIISQAIPQVASSQMTERERETICD